MFFHVIQPLPNSELVITTRRSQDHKFYTNWSCPVRQEILRPRILLLLAADFLESSSSLAALFGWKSGRLLRLRNPGLRLLATALRFRSNCDHARHDIESEQYASIGVLPAEFAALFSACVIVPFDTEWVKRVDSDLDVFGKLKRGATMRQASEEMNVIEERIAIARPWRKL